MVTWWTRAREAIAVVRLRPFETLTSEGRSKERLRRVALSGLASATAQGVAILVSLIMVPLALGYLGTERYGLWMTISSVIAVLACAELGIGSGLLTLLADANGRDDGDAARGYVSSSFFVLSAVAVLVGLGAVLVYPWIPWLGVFNVTSPQAAADIRPTLAVVLGGLLLMLPLVVVQRVQMGYQEGFVNGLWSAVGSMLGLTGVMLAISARLPLPWLAAAVAGAPVLATGVNGAILFASRRPWLRPRWGDVSAWAAERLFKTGVLFFFLELATVVTYHADNIIIGRFLGAEQVTQYAVPMKLFVVVLQALGFVLMALWPAYGEAFARGDKSWVRRTFVKTTALAFAAVLACAVLLLALGPLLIDLWVGSQITPPFHLLAGFAIWMVLSSLSRSMATVFNGAHILRFQVICAVPMSAAHVLISVFLVQTIGIAGPIYSAAATQLVFLVLPYGWYLWKLLDLAGDRPGGAGA